MESHVKKKIEPIWIEIYLEITPNQWHKIIFLDGTKDFGKWQFESNVFFAPKTIFHLKKIKNRNGVITSNNFFWTVIMNQKMTNFLSEWTKKQLWKKD